VRVREPVYQRNAQKGYGRVTWRDVAANTAASLLHASSADRSCVRLTMDRSSLAQCTRRAFFGDCGRLNAGETVDMPVFFFIDPEILKDRTLRHVRNIVLAYTFFESNDQSLPEIQKASEALSAAADGRVAAAIGS
jgi:hypothetical protein